MSTDFKTMVHGPQWLRPRTVNRDPRIWWLACLTGKSARLVGKFHCKYRSRRQASRKDLVWKTGWELQDITMIRLIRLSVIFVLMGVVRATIERRAAYPGRGWSHAG